MARRDSEAITDLQAAQAGQWNANRLNNQGDGLARAIAMGHGERNAFAVAGGTNDDELTWPAMADDAWRFDHQPSNLRGQQIGF